MTFKNVQNNALQEILKIENFTKRIQSNKTENVESNKRVSPEDYSQRHNVNIRVLLGIYMQKCVYSIANVQTFTYM